MKDLLTAGVIVAVVLTAVPVAILADQQAPPPPPPAPRRSQDVVPAPPPPPPPAAPAAPVNVRINIAIVDEGGPQTLRENVTLTTVDRQEASVRSDADVQGVGAVILNVDATPQVSGLPAGKIRVRIGLDYLPRSEPSQRGARTRLQLAVIVDDGKTIVASDTSDPATDRRVRVEVTATLLK